MNYKSKIILVLALMLIVSAVFIGCDQIPEEYTEGVKLDKSYPDDDMPLYDDAIVFYCEDDDESVSIKYGVEDDLDDVADFYKDHFEDNEITLDDETDKSSRYSAEGTYKDFKFEVKVSEPSGDYEEKVFTTVVKVDIEFIDDSLGSVEDLQNGDDNTVSLSQNILGFWRQESYEDLSGNKQATYDNGTAYEFMVNGDLNLYFNFQLVGTGGWSEADSSTVLLTAIGGDQENVSVVFERRSEKDYLIWTDSTGILTFFRDSSEGFSTEGDTPEQTETPTSDGHASAGPLTDDALASAISGYTWYYIQYVDAEGGIQNSSSGDLIYYSNGTLEDIFDGETTTGNWYVSGQRLYCDYDNGDSVNWEVQVEYRGSAEYLIYYSNDNPGAYWVYSDFPRDSVVQYTTDADMTAAISGQDFNVLYYMYSDGSKEPMSDNPMTYNADGTFNDLYEGEPLTGTWEFADGYLKLYYDTKDDLHYPALVEYNSVNDVYCLFLGDLEEGYEGCYWIYTTYQP